MHGRNRQEYKALQRDPQVAAKSAHKAQQWFTLTQQVLTKQASTPPAVQLQLTAKLVTVNPDPLYLWNLRRQALLATSLDEDNAEWLTTERSLTATALQANPKAYGAWFHRKWCLERTTATGTTNEDLYKEELGLTVQFLQRDERNFHCWNYRRFVVAHLLSSLGNGGAWKLWLAPDDNATTTPVALQMGRQMAQQSSSEQKEEDAPSLTPAQLEWVQHEWDFTSQKIRENFSNFSAFHYRSKLYPLLAAASPASSDNEDSLGLLDTEIQLVEDAVFTEPDDQTAWWYQHFLLKCSNDTNSLLLRERWQQHMSALQELATEVPHSKWVRLGLVNGWQALGEMEGTAAPSETTTNTTTTATQLKETLQELMELDPDRRGRYQSLLRRLSKQQAS